jgi:hypothetical protein
LDDGVNKANRFYQIFVVNVDTMDIQTTYCNNNAITMPPLSPNERFLITVGVSWVPHGRIEVKRMVLTTLIPG